MKTALSEEEFSLAVAFLDGTLAEPERVRFELRLAAEPELAAAVEALFEIDEGLRRHAARQRERREEPRVRRPSLVRRWSIAALAALALAAFVIAVRERAASRAERGAEPHVLVAVAESNESARDFAERSELLRGLRPPGLEVLRSGSEDVNVSAADFAAKAQADEEGLARAALASGAAEARAGFFVVPIENDRPISVVIVAEPEQGGPFRLWPGGLNGLMGRLAPGRHVLPAPRFLLIRRDDSAHIEYHRGFLVPVGARSLEVLVATRAEPLDFETLRTIDAALAKGEARIELEQRGFSVHALRVSEPQDQ